MMGSVLRFMQPSPLVTPESPVYRPPSFPPPNDWPVSPDKKGNPLSVFGDNYWDFTAFGYYGFNFGRHVLSEDNLALVKQVLVFVMYHPRLFPGKVQSCEDYFQILVKIGKVCDLHGITIRDLHKFPRVLPLVVDALQSANLKFRIAKLHKLIMYRGELGFSVGNDQLLKLMAMAEQKRYPVQHAYIPPRIWNYQIQKLNEVLDDFAQHQVAIEKAFKWLHWAYQHNLKVSPKKYQSPFVERHLHRKRVLCDGSFDDFLDDYGLLGLFQRWLPERTIYGIRGVFSANHFSRYLTLVRDVAIIFILNFSMQRKGEVSSLRSDCFQVEKDKYLGDICTLVGETTKTDEDSDARWVVPKTVKKAVDVATSVARLRLSALPEDMHIPKRDKQNPHLLFPSTEHWSCNSSKVRKAMLRHGALLSKESLDYDNLIRRDLDLFDADVIRITEDDAQVALSMTPNLYKRAWFGIGKPWHFSAHQLRRTLAVNMFASDAVSTSSIQHQMKHLSRNMTLYYGRHHTNLRLNSAAETALILESYNSVYQKLVDVIEDEEDNVRPHGNIPGFDSVVDLVNAGEVKKLIKLIRDGQVGIRSTLLGFCMKTGSCEYGGIESISKCAGGDGKGICVDAIFERKNKDKLIKLRASHQAELERLPPNSMRVAALNQEIHAIGVYLNVIDRQKTKAGS